MNANKNNTFGARSSLETGTGKVTYYKLDQLTRENVADISRLPFSIKLLLESILRNENGVDVTRDDVIRLAKYNPESPARNEIPFKPARVLMQDFTGVPAVVDLAALRSAMARIGGDPQKINPLIPVELVIDHSVQVDFSASHDALQKNSEIEFERNRERYEFIRWGQTAFDNFFVVPPASGICHQVNLEYLGKVVQQREIDGEVVAFPDSLVGTDSHTTMINGLGIIGWGVGGIEAEAGLLGQPLYMLPPEVIGFKLTGSLPAGTTATDLVLTVTEILRKKGVVGKFVEFFGSGLSNMSLTDRATIANMAPEYGATMGFFPVDDRTIEFLKYTGRSAELIDLVGRYCKVQGLFRTSDTPDPIFKDIVELDMASVKPSVAGPKRPQDRSSLSDLKESWKASLEAPIEKYGYNLDKADLNSSGEIKFTDKPAGKLSHGDVVIASITSCTNTSNPAVLIGAGILAKKAVEAGLTVKPFVKTSFAPGSKVVTDYLEKAGLLPYLEKLGFHIVGYGCMTCIGNSGPLPQPVVDAITENNLIAASVLSGNRNFPGRVHPYVKASYLMSPPLVVSFAIAGTVDIELEKAPLGSDKNGKAVYLRDIWPSDSEIAEFMRHVQDPEMYRDKYKGIDSSNETWNRIEATSDPVYNWDETSTYIQEPPFFLDMSQNVEPIQRIDDARVLVKAGDSVTTDHISPAGVIPQDSPAGRFLIDRGIQPSNFNSFGSRRGNDRIMTRGTFGNIMFNNLLAGGKTGGWTAYQPSGEIMSIYDASVRYMKEGVPVIVLAGNDYGMGSSRDWAAKGTFLLGIKAVIAKSFERIHRSNLVGMGVLPLQFKDGQDSDTLGLTGTETFSIDIDDALTPGQDVAVTVVNSAGESQTFIAICRLDTLIEVDYYRNGGILHTVLRKVLKEG